MTGALAGFVIALSVVALIVLAGLIALSIYTVVHEGDLVPLAIVVVLFGIPATGALIGWLLL